MMTRDLRRVLFASVLFSLMLVAARIVKSHSYIYSSFIWNLFLAYVPIMISSLATRVAGYPNRPVLFFSLLGLWMLFFPNAPYIITDLFHLDQKPFVPLWYDLLLIYSFAWNGLIIGYLSLMQMEEEIRRRLGTRWSRVFVLLVLCLSSYGVFLGRFLRWNSWDMVTSPFRLLVSCGQLIVHPLEHPGVWGMTLLMSILMGLIYLTLRTIPEWSKNRREPASPPSSED